MNAQQHARQMKLWRVKNPQYYARRRARKRADGECYDCTGAALPGQTRCEKHREQNVQRCRRYRKLCAVR